LETRLATPSVDQLASSLVHRSVTALVHRLVSKSAHRLASVSGDPSARMLVSRLAQRLATVSANRLARMLERRLAIELARLSVTEWALVHNTDQCPTGSCQSTTNLPYIASLKRILLRTSHMGSQEYNMHLQSTRFHTSAHSICRRHPTDKCLPDTQRPQNTRHGCCSCPPRRCMAHVGHSNLLPGETACQGRDWCSHRVARNSLHCRSNQASSGRSGSCSCHKRDRFGSRCPRRSRLRIHLRQNLNHKKNTRQCKCQLQVRVYISTSIYSAMGCYT
jgi:hypothetical protein